MIGLRTGHHRRNWLTSRREWEQWRWLQDCDDADEKAKKPKAFEHRIAESKCPNCRMVVMLRGKQVCLASGKLVSDEMGTGQCAFEAKSG